MYNNKKGNRPNSSNTLCWRFFLLHPLSDSNFERHESTTEKNESMHLRCVWIFCFEIQTESIPFIWERGSFYLFWSTNTTNSNKYNCDRKGNMAMENLKMRTGTETRTQTQMTWFNVITGGAFVVLPSRKRKTKQRNENREKSSVFCCAVQ